MKYDKRKKKSLIVLVVFLVIVVVICYVVPLATIGAGATEITDGYGTDDPSVIPPETEVPPEEPKPPATLDITSYPPTMDVGDRSQLRCDLLNAPEGTYEEWSSGNSEVVVVDPTGSIVAIAPGDAEISVRAGDLRASAWVHVNDYKASKLTILVAGLSGEQDELGRLVYKIKVGDVCRLTSQIEPKGAKVERISWTVSDQAIAKLEGGDFIATAKGGVSVTADAGALSDTVYFEIGESGIPVKTIIFYIVVIAVTIAAIIIISVIAAGAAKRRKEEERRQAAAAKRRKDEARQRAEEAAKRAADEAEIAAAIERNKQVLDMEASSHRPAKVSGATVSAATGLSDPRDINKERPLMLDDVE